MFDGDRDQRARHRAGQGSARRLSRRAERRISARLIRQAPIIPETVDARDVVAILRDLPVHIGLVHDEYGVFQGVVTSADILEAIVGSFHTEEGPAEPAYVRRDDGSYLISGWMPALEFADLLDIALPAPRPYQTCAGFLLQEFGAIPGCRRQDFEPAAGASRSSTWTGGASTRCSRRGSRPKPRGLRSSRKPHSATTSPIEEERAGEVAGDVVPANTNSGRPI